MKPETLIWLFPIIFMFHEFEEIISMRRWLGKNKDVIQIKFPKIRERLVQQYEWITTEKFSLIVAEEFLIVSIIVLVSALCHNYNLYIGLVIAYFIHILPHLAQTILLRKYTPGIVTAFLTGVFCVLVFLQFNKSGLLSFDKAFMYSGILTMFVFLNLRFMYYIVKKL